MALNETHAQSALKLLCRVADERLEELKHLSNSRTCDSSEDQ